jgi:hypothetical protein
MFLELSVKECMFLQASSLLQVTVNINNSNGKPEKVDTHIAASYLVLHAGPNL